MNPIDVQQTNPMYSKICKQEIKDGNDKKRW